MNGRAGHLADRHNVAGRRRERDKRYELAQVHVDTLVVVAPCIRLKANPGIPSSLG
jgi:hypothetical protein